MKIVLLVFGIGLTGVSATGLFSSNKKLLGMAHVIGTKNPIIARIACILCLAIGLATLYVLANSTE